MGEVNELTGKFRGGIAEIVALRLRRRSIFTTTLAINRLETILAIFVEQPEESGFHKFHGGKG